MHTSSMLRSRLSIALVTLGCAFLLGACYSGAEDDDGGDGASEPVETAQDALILGWTSWTSEEYAPITCDNGSLISQLHFSGSYSDMVRAYCKPTGASVASVAWQPYFSEEGSGTQLCPGGSWVSGVACNGSYCDNISLQCTYLAGSTASECDWSPWVSEESGGILEFPAHFYAQGAECYGRFCDYMRFRICRKGQSQ